MLEALCSALLAAKLTMELAKDEVLRIEKLILDYAPEKLEGSQTLHPTGFKLTITSKLSRKLDYDTYQALDIPDSMQFVTLEPSIDLTKLRLIEQLEPVLVAQCVTTKPAKTGIKVEVSDES